MPSRGRLRQHLTDLRKSKLIESVAGDDGTKTYIVNQPMEVAELLERVDKLRWGPLQDRVERRPALLNASEVQSRNRRLAEVLKAMGNDLRMLIVECLLPKSSRAKAKSLSVNAICSVLGDAAAGTISQHVAILRQAGVVRMSPKANQRIYSLTNGDAVKDVLRAAAALCTKLFGDWQIGTDERRQALRLRRASSEQATIFRALANDDRLKVVRCLVRMKTEASTAEIRQKINGTIRGSAARHLEDLQRRALVVGIKKKSQVRFRLRNRAVVEEMLDRVEQLLEKPSKKPRKD